MKKVSLAGLNNGAAEELFEREMAIVMENTQDPSTDPKAPRKITLEFIFTPNEGREMGVLEVKAKSSLAPAKSTGSTFVIRNNGKAYVSLEPDYHQPGFGFDKKRVLSIDKKSKTSGEKDYE